jgi:hypothetical protein
MLIASFNRVRYRRNDADVFLYAFDLIELNGDEAGSREGLGSLDRWARAGRRHGR